MIMQKANTEAGLQLGSHKSLNSAHTRFVVIRAAPVIYSRSLRSAQSRKRVPSLALRPSLRFAVIT
jgi:hypothetical protein